MYNVHMKRVTASEARRDWFRLLDEVADGEVVTIDRGGRRIVIRREEKKSVRERPPADYSAILSIPQGSDADEWSWEWNETGVELRERVKEEREE
jgi:antitoxin (DNA-binding transcriptional repressor) of toxin-antitoxin stability system